MNLSFFSESLFCKNAFMSDQTSTLKETTANITCHDQSGCKVSLTCILHQGYKQTRCVKMLQLQKYKWSSNSIEFLQTYLSTWQKNNTVWRVWSLTMFCTCATILLSSRKPSDMCLIISNVDVCCNYKHSPLSTTLQTNSSVIVCYLSA